MSKPDVPEELRDWLVRTIQYNKQLEGKYRSAANSPWRRLPADPPPPPFPFP